MKRIVFIVMLLTLFPASGWAKRALVNIDGSSTVFPITEAVAEDFQAQNRKIRVTIGVSGTGGGFKKFCKGEIDIANASRPIKPSEVKLCAGNRVDYIEIPVAYDGIAVVVNPRNNWVRSFTVKALKKLWEPEAKHKVTHWNQIQPGWPKKEIHLYGPGIDSGTFDYFTEAIVGESGASRGDFTASEDDNVLVQGISTDLNALGFFGVAYYEYNKNRLKLVPIDDEKNENGKGPILPGYDNIVKGIYQPLARPIFIYVSKSSAERPEIQKFIEFFMNQGGELSKEVGYIALSDRAYGLAHERFQKRVTGSIFGGKGAQVGVKVEDLLEKKGK